MPDAPRDLRSLAARIEWLLNEGHSCWCQRSTRSIPSRESWTMLFTGIGLRDQIYVTAGSSNIAQAYTKLTLCQQGPAVHWQRFRLPVSQVRRKCHCFCYRASTNFRLKNAEFAKIPLALAKHSRLRCFTQAPRAGLSSTLADL